MWASPPGVTCGDTVFQYSGYLAGLIQLCNALYPVAPDLWDEIAGRWFYSGAGHDWNENNAYWAALESPIEDAAGQAYDAFLKGNGRSWGCAPTEPVSICWSAISEENERGRAAYKAASLTNTPDYTAKS